MAEDSGKLEDRISHATRPLTRDNEIAGRVVTQAKLASFMAIVGGIVTHQRDLSHALIRGDKVDAAAALNKVDEGILELISGLRTLIAASGSDQ